MHDEESQKLVTINTQKGLFQYTQLPFGVSSAPEIFQCLMENILQGIPQVTVYLDDILITEAEHLTRLEMVLTRLQLAGLRVNKDKCSFMVKAVEYLGHTIDAEGLHHLPGKVEVVQNTPSPQDADQS